MKLNLNDIGNCPDFITSSSVDMLTVMGSRAYETNTDDSDWDFYGFIVPPIEFVFPHTAGVISGFDRQTQAFDQYQGQHLLNPKGEEFDITIYNIVKYFRLCMEGNPNMIDSLFTDSDKLRKTSQIGAMVRSQRRLFLSMKCYHTFRGMAHSHMSRLTSRERVGKRSSLVEKYGYDVKDASHVLRILLELSQILLTGDLDLTKEADRLIIMEVKRGEWSKEQVINFFNIEMKRLEEITQYKVPHFPDEVAIKELLVDCLEYKYGSLREFGVWL